jgi:hypothetical protein
MLRSFLVLLVAILMFVVSAPAQTRRQQKTLQSQSPITDIRSIDFLNFTYQSSLCTSVFGVPGIVKVRQGKFENNNSYFWVIDNKVLYGDVNGDGREEAIVSAGCGGHGGNFSDSEVFIYTLENGRAKLLAKVNSHQMERDYVRYYPEGFLVGVSENGIRVENGHIIVEMYANGSNASPEFIAMMDYQLSRTRLVLSGKPQRRHT